MKTRSRLESYLGFHTGNCIPLRPAIGTGWLPRRTSSCVTRSTYNRWSCEAALFLVLLRRFSISFSHYFFLISFGSKHEYWRYSKISPQALHQNRSHISCAARNCRESRDLAFYSQKFAAFGPKDTSRLGLRNRSKRSSSQTARNSTCQFSSWNLHPQINWNHMIWPCRSILSHLFRSLKCLQTHLRKTTCRSRKSGGSWYLWKRPWCPILLEFWCLAIKSLAKQGSWSGTWPRWLMVLAPRQVSLQWPQASQKDSGLMLWLSARSLGAPFRSSPSCQE